METSIDVVIVEDDPMVMELHRQYVEKVKGYRVQECLLNGKEGLEVIIRNKPRLAILDIYLPGMSGLEILKQIRGNGIDTDVILITAAHDPESLGQGVQYGVMDYILKPFTFRRFKKALVNYQRYRTNMLPGCKLSQQEIDGLLAINRSPEREERQRKSDLPKGLQQATLEVMIQRLERQPGYFTVTDVALDMGISRVTARRYLTYLQEHGWLKAELSYGPVGRPMSCFIVDRSQTPQ